MAEGTPTMEVRTRLTAESADFTRGMEKATRATQQFTQSAGALRSMLNTTAIVTAGFTTAVVAFGFKAFNAAARVDELDIAINAVGKSTGLGYQAIQDTAVAIKGMGIEMDVAQKAALKFAQNNLKLEYASQLARAAQDLAVISGQNSTDTFNMLTHAVITGRSEVLKSVGIQKSADQMYADFAASIGKTTKQLTYQEKQQAVATGALAEAAKVAGTYEAAMTTPGKVLRSFARLQNEIMVAMGGALLDGFGPAIYSAYKMVQSFSKAVQTSEYFQSAIKAVGMVIGKIMAPFKKLFDTLKGYIDGMVFAEKTTSAFGDKLTKPAIRLQDFASNLEWILPPLAGLTAGLAALGGKTFLNFVPGMGGFAKVLKPLPIAMVAVALTSTQMRSAMGNLLNALKPLLNPLKEVARIISVALSVAVAVLAKGITYLANGIKNVTAFFKENQRILTIVTSVIGGLTAAYIASSIALRAQVIVSKIATWWTLQQSKAQGHLNAVMAMNPIFKVILLITGLVTAIVLAYRANEDFAEGFRRVFNFIASIVGSVISFVLRVLGNLLLAFASLMDTNTAFGRLVANIFNIVYNVIYWFVTTVLKIFRFFVDGFVELMETSQTFRKFVGDAFNVVARVISTVISAIITYIAAFIKVIATLLYALGKAKDIIFNIFIYLFRGIRYILSGIIDALGFLLDKVGEFVDFIREKVSNFIGFLAKAAAKLPDKLGGNEISGWLTQFQVAVRGASDSVKTLNENASRKTLDDMAKGAEKSVDALTETNMKVLDFIEGIGNYKTGVSGALSQVANTLIGFAKKAVSFTAQDLGSKIADGLLVAAKGASVALNTILKAIEPAKNFDIGGAIVDTLGENARKAGNFLIGLAGTVTQFTQQDAFAKLGDAFSNMIEKLKTGLGFGDVLKEEREKAEAAAKGGSDADKAAEQIAAQADAMKNIREAMANGIDGIRNVIQDLRDAAIEFAKSIAETITSFAGLKAIELPDGFIPKAKSLIENMRMRLDKSVKFADQIASLQALGLDPTALKDIIEMGPIKGSQIAASILAGEADTIQQINQLNKAIQFAGASIGGYGARAVYEEPIRNAVNTLQGIEAEALRVRNAQAGSSNVVVSQGAVQIVVDASMTKTAEEMSDVVVKEIERVFGTLAKELAAK